MVLVSLGTAQVAPGFLTLKQQNYGNNKRTKPQIASWHRLCGSSHPVHITLRYADQRVFNEGH
jgi:hypothetical protein